ncbi:MAG TPA: hypothetical protein VF648_18225 [Pyrinomonadaceae bacterium]|jgi:hypothetical protein
MAILPNADKAIVPIEKLRDYSLNSYHDRGKHKARVFASALGMMQTDAPRLRDMILQAVLTNEAVEIETNEHGTRHTMDFRALGLKGEITICTAWIIDAGEDVPRLVSCYVKV